MSEGYTMITVKDNVIYVDCCGYFLISDGKDIYKELCSLFEKHYEAKKWVIHEHIADIFVNYLSKELGRDFTIGDNMTFFGLPVEIKKQD